jgi:alkylation response protein AidB-like acyl-CoA dehydrogenase
VDLPLEPHERAFRDELLAWLEHAPVPPGLRDYGATPTADDVEPAKAWQRTLYEGGWAGIGWPVEHGGRGASVVEEAIFAEELARARLPRQLNLVGFDLAGPMIIRYGTEEQRSRFLPRILTGQDVWSQLFSEPDAGSDLAGLRTAATRTGEAWCVSGQKVWTSGAHYSDYGLLLARTGGGERHRGITCFVLPMRSEGIDARPIEQMDGESKFNEVFLDGVTIPDELVLGEVNAGWIVAMSTLGRERRTLGAHAVQYFAHLDELRGEIVARGLGVEVRDRWAELWWRVRGLRLTWLRELSGGADGSEPRMSLLKLLSTEIQRDLTILATEVLGADLVAGDAYPEWRHRLLAAPGASIAGGTSEIQRSIIAERVLGLPRR